MPDGRTRASLLPRDEWIALRLDTHPGFISWADFERNQKQNQRTAKAFGQDRRHGPLREGPALLQGLTVRGVCGTRMSVRYRLRHGRLLPTYTCRLRAMDHREPTCQILHGEAIDAAIGDLLVALMTPMALEEAPALCLVASPSAPAPTLAVPRATAGTGLGAGLTVAREPPSLGEE